MSNGGFGGIHGKLLDALRARTALTRCRPHLLYLHGFRSSPQSTKARQLGAGSRAHGPTCSGGARSCRLAARGDATARGGIGAWPRDAWRSSAARSAASTPRRGRAHGCRAVLLNPAIEPARDLRGHIGETTAWHSDERFFFRAEFIDELRALRRADHAPERYFAVIAKGDEVLDWREMTARYAGCRIKLLEGGDHALSDFDDAPARRDALPRPRRLTPGRLQADDAAPRGARSRR
jgi:predicted esterase YcpF (UPF0227 family)